jgi:hypothetical protein
MSTPEKKVKVQLDRRGVIAVAEQLTGDVRAKFCLAYNGRMFVEPIAAALADVKRPRAPIADDGDPIQAEIRLHNALGQAIWSGLTMLMADPDLDAAVTEAAARVREGFGPKAPALRALPGDRVKEASRVRDEMAARADDLAKLPPLPSGTVGQRIERWCAIGAGLTGELVEARITREAAVEAPTRTRAMNDVARLNSLIVQARTALRAEVAFDAALPRTLEAECFTLYDTLLETQRVHAERKARREGKKAAASGEKPAASDEKPAEAPAEKPAEKPA